jgi:predicted nucleic acid-binding protein
MKAPAIVYLDTSFFTGLLENESGRQVDCKEVVRWERQQGSTIYTSFLTLDEFLVRHYDLYKRMPDCNVKADERIGQIREIANIYGLNDDVTKESARLQSTWGEFRMSQKPALPRDRKFRWDAIHIATASVLEADRVYAFDGPWNDFPKSEIPNIGEIICPAKPPVTLFTKIEEKQSEEEAVKLESTESPAEATAKDEPKQPDESDETQIQPTTNDKGDSANDDEENKT